MQVTNPAEVHRILGQARYAVKAAKKKISEILNSAKREKGLSEKAAAEIDYISKTIRELESHLSAVENSSGVGFPVIGTAVAVAIIGATGVILSWLNKSSDKFSQATIEIISSSALIISLGIGLNFALKGVASGIIAARSQ